MITFSNFLINKIKGEIDDLEVELNHQHNDSSISPTKKSKKIVKILKNITHKKQILELYINYILESQKIEHGTSSE